MDIHAYGETSHNVPVSNRVGPHSIGFLHSINLTQPIARADFPSFLVGVMLLQTLVGEFRETHQVCRLLDR